MSPVEPPWIVVAGGFHDLGGMDRLNAALARHLASRGTPVHLVGHDVDAALEGWPGVTVTRVRRPIGSFVTGEMRLAQVAARIRRACARNGSDPVLLGNGGNVAAADINWVHSVHHAWPCADAGAPLWFRAKNGLFKGWSRRREARALHHVPTIIANSRRTKEDLVATVGVEADRIHVVYPGSPATWVPASPLSRAAARAQWCRDARPLVVMIGAISRDVNKGLDTLLTAWRMLAADAAWDADLVVAGPGHVAHWRGTVSDLPSVRFTGRIDTTGELIDAADLLVSPVRYEAYGLAVHEAAARETPVLVSHDAGVVERFPPGTDHMRLERPRDPGAIVDRLRAWRADLVGWRDRAEVLGPIFRAWTMDDMSAEIACLGDGVTRAASRA